MKYPDTQGRYFRGGGVWINKASLNKNQPPRYCCGKYRPWYNRNGNQNKN